MLANKEYKESGVVWLGLVPKYWNVQRLKNVLVDRNEANEPVKTDFILSLTNDRGVIPYSEKGDVGNKSKDDVTGYKLAYPGDIVLNSMNVIIGSVGLSNYFGAVSPVYYMLYPRNKADEVKYYNYIFQTREFQQSLKGYGNGIMEIRMRIPIGNLNNVMLPVPTPAEQKAIADYLDKECARIDDIVEKQRNIIEKLKEYKKSVITEAVTRGLNPNAPMKDSGIEWIGKIPENWEISKVSFFFDIQLGKMVQPNKENEFDIERPYLCAVNFGNNTFKLDTIKTMWFSPAEIELYRVSVGDLFVVEGGDIASSDFVTHPLEDFGFQNALHRVRARASADTRFLRYLLIVAKNMGYIDLICNKATIAHFSKDKFQNMPFLVAPLSEQQAIADYLDKKSAEVDTIIEKRERMIELMTEYKKSLIYECVTGKKEIVDVVE